MPRAWANRRSLLSCSAVAAVITKTADIAGSWAVRPADIEAAGEEEARVPSSSSPAGRAVGSVRATIDRRSCPAMRLSWRGRTPEHLCRDQCGQPAEQRRPLGHQSCRPERDR